MTEDDLSQMDLHVGDADWQPTPHGNHLAAMLLAHNLVRGKHVLELGGGVGNHTILLARQGPQLLVSTEITTERLQTTERNVRHNCPGLDCLEFRVADWLSTEGEFDVIVANPPFARSGQRNRRYFIDSLILDSHKRLAAGGELVFVQSSMADIAKSQRRLEENGYTVAELGRSSGPFRDYYFEDPSFMAEIETVPDAYELRDGRHFETLVVFRATLAPWQPPAGSH